MKKDIKIGIIGASISAGILALMVFLLTDEGLGFKRALSQESSKGVRIAFFLVIFLCVLIGFLGFVYFLALIITNFVLEISDKRRDKYNCKLEEEIKSKIPKGTKFRVNIANLNDKELKEFLCEKLECTALFNGSDVYIEFSLPEKVEIETDNLLWLDQNFNY